MIERIRPVELRSCAVHVAKYCFEGTLEARSGILFRWKSCRTEASPRIAAASHREREVLRNRARLGLRTPRPSDDGENHYTFTDEPVAVMNSACEGCPLQRYTVTSNCQHCMAKRCLQSLPFRRDYHDPLGRRDPQPGRRAASAACAPRRARITPSPMRAAPARAPARWTRFPVG